jgi:16S rRNA (uracil1498-N3)-methyltransferase
MGLCPGERQLESAPARYVTRVHRLGVGDRFTAFDPEQALEAEAEIVEVSRNAVRCRIDAPHSARAVPRFDITLIQALGKGDKPERVIRDATALGVRRVVFIDSARVVARVSSESRRRRWRQVAVDSSRQCGRADMPGIEGPISLRKALAEWASEDALRLVLDPSAVRSLGDRLRDWTVARPLIVLIGPEGGFDTAEHAVAADARFEAVSLGPFVLRTETAVTACLGAIVSHASFASLDQRG